MSFREVKDTVSARTKQKENEIYNVSAWFRLAVLSCFSSDVQFPAPPVNEDGEENWKNSYNYLKALQKKQQGRC